jgi:hypothetical protein
MGRNMSRRKAKITLNCEGYEPLMLNPAPPSYKELLTVGGEHYETEPEGIHLSYFNYKVQKF